MYLTYVKFKEILQYIHDNLSAPAVNVARLKACQVLKHVFIMIQVKVKVISSNMRAIKLNCVHKLFIWFVTLISYSFYTMSPRIASSKAGQNSSLSRCADLLQANSRVSSAVVNTLDCEPMDHRFVPEPDRITIGKFNQAIMI